MNITGFKDNKVLFYFLYEKNTIADFIFKSFDINVNLNKLLIINSNNPKFHKFLTEFRGEIDISLNRRETNESPITNFEINYENKNIVLDLSKNTDSRLYKFIQTYNLIVDSDTCKLCFFPEISELHLDQLQKVYFKRYNGLNNELCNQLCQMNIFAFDDNSGKYVLTDTAKYIYFGDLYKYAFLKEDTRVLSLNDTPFFVLKKSLPIAASIAILVGLFIIYQHNKNDTHNNYHPIIPKVDSKRYITYDSIKKKKEKIKKTDIQIPKSVIYSNLKKNDSLYYEYRSILKTNSSLFSEYEYHYAGEETIKILTPSLDSVLLFTDTILFKTNVIVDTYTVLDNKNKHIIENSINSNIIKFKMPNYCNASAYILILDNKRDNISIPFIYIPHKISDAHK